MRNSELRLLMFEKSAIADCAGHTGTWAIAGCRLGVVDFWMDQHSGRMPPGTKVLRSGSITATERTTLGLLAAASAITRTRLRDGQPSRWLASLLSEVHEAKE